MFASIRQYDASPEDIEELTELARASFLPRLQKDDGFQAYYVVDGGKGEFISVTIFSDEEGAHRSIAMARDWVKTNAASLLPNPPRVFEGEVTIAAGR